jgi:hypothetical protein
MSSSQKVTKCMIITHVGWQSSTLCPRARYSHLVNSSLKTLHTKNYFFYSEFSVILMTYLPVITTYLRNICVQYSMKLAAVLAF